MVPRYAKRLPQGDLLPKHLLHKWRKAYEIDKDVRTPDELGR